MGGAGEFRIARRFRVDCRGLYRIFNRAEYRLYRSQEGPPAEDATPFAASASLPVTPPDTFDDGTWYLSMSYFNGVLDSGFLPIGAGGETYRRLSIAAGSAVGSPPAGPLSWHIELAASGSIRIVGLYYEAGSNRADQWAIAYTIDGSTPPEASPDAVEDLPASGLAVLTHTVPAVADGTTIKVRLQSRRNDGTTETPQWIYSESSTVQSATVATTGPTAPIAADAYPGDLPLAE